MFHSLEDGVGSWKFCIFGMWFWSWMIFFRKFGKSKQKYSPKMCFNLHDGYPFFSDFRASSFRWQGRHRGWNDWDARRSREVHCNSLHVNIAMTRMTRFSNFWVFEEFLSSQKPETLTIHEKYHDSLQLICKFNQLFITNFVWNCWFWLNCQNCSFCPAGEKNVAKVLQSFGIDDEIRCWHGEHRCGWGLETGDVFFEDYKQATRYLKQDRGMSQTSWFWGSERSEK